MISPMCDFIPQHTSSHMIPWHYTCQVSSNIDPQQLTSSQYFSSVLGWRTNNHEAGSLTTLFKSSFLFCTRFSYHKFNTRVQQITASWTFFFLLRAHTPPVPHSELMRYEPTCLSTLIPCKILPGL